MNEEITYKVVRHGLSGVKKVVFETKDKKEAYQFRDTQIYTNQPGKFYVVFPQEKTAYHKKPKKVYAKKHMEEK